MTIFPTRRQPEMPPAQPAADARFGLQARDASLLALAAVATVGSGACHLLGAPTVLAFVVSAVALAVLASLVGRSVEALGDRLGAGTTGVLQSALGNLPELFVCVFALRAGLTGVVQATIVGSVLANVLLVLGAAFVVGGLRHGTQRFSATAGRSVSLMLLLAVSVLAIPTLTSALHTPAAGHEAALSRLVAVVMLVVFACALPSALRHGSEIGSEGGSQDGRETGADEGSDPVVEVQGGSWPLGVAVAVLASAGVAAALVSDWFVAALSPAMTTLHISQAFAGLVIVAIAGNAVENVVGIQLAARNQADYAISVILQSPVQVALVVAPVLVLVAPALGVTFTLVLSPLLLAALLLSAVVAVVVVVDGQSTAVEGAALLGLYAAIAASVWWG